ncbi:helix-turn-helix transcriptional regulator [Streptomyces decoyicus]|uniref:helix-turn-helix transcriptional regulator n=1 Tax=Streptomyces decoyicus TaxID=249567 RepID=UPI0033B6B051
MNPANEPVNSPCPRRVELGDFLRKRRARLNPADVGLVADGRRRTPGLRREEVAVLANIGLSWYSWLEQGKDINVSNRVLDAISQALRLSVSERVHLYYLAGVHPPQPGQDAGRPSDLTRMVRVTEGYAPNPAALLDRYWNVVSANGAARYVFGLADEQENLLLRYFTDSAMREIYPQEESLSRRLVTQLLIQAAEFPDDPVFATLVGRLRAESHRFAELWELHEIVDITQEPLLVRHPVLGDLFFEYAVLHLADHTDHRLVLHTPVPSTDTEERLAWLAETPHT